MYGVAVDPSAAAIEAIDFFPGPSRAQLRGAFADAEVALNARFSPNEPTAAHRKVVMNFRRVQMQPVVIDDVEVGLVTFGDDATIGETDRQCRLARLRRDDEGDRQFVAAGAVAGPVRQQIGREAGIADDAAMGTAVA